MQTDGQPPGGSAPSSRVVVSFVSLLLFLFMYVLDPPPTNYTQIQDKSTFAGDYVLYQNCTSLVEVNVSSKTWFKCENVG